MFQSMSQQQASIRHQHYAQYLFLYALAGHLVFMLPYILTSNAFVIANNILCILIDLLAMRLNQRGKTRLAMALFMLAITYHATASMLIFGLYAGLSYYYLTMVLIIIFSPFNFYQKSIGILVQAILMLAMIQYSFTHDAILVLNDTHLILWHLGHGLANICAIVYSAYFYLKTNESMESLVDVMQETSAGSVSHPTELEHAMAAEMDRSHREGIGMGLIFMKFPEALSSSQWAHCHQLIRDQVRLYDHIYPIGKLQAMVITCVKEAESIDGMAQRIESVLKISCQKGHLMKFVVLYTSVSDLFDQELLMKKGQDYLDELSDREESYIFRTL